MAKTSKSQDNSHFGNPPLRYYNTSLCESKRSADILRNIFACFTKSASQEKIQANQRDFPGKRKGGTDHLLRMACPALPLSACSVQGKACALGFVLAAGRAAAHGDHTGCAGIVLLVDTVARRTADLQRRVRHGAGAAVGKGAVLLLEGGAIRLVTAAGCAALYLDAGTAAAAIPEIRAVLYIAL